MLEWPLLYIAKDPDINGTQYMIFEHHHSNVLGAFSSFIFFQNGFSSNGLEVVFLSFYTSVE